MFTVVSLRSERQDRERTYGDEVRGTRVDCGVGIRTGHDNVGCARYDCVTVTAILFKLQIQTENLVTPPASCLMQTAGTSVAPGPRRLPPQTV